MENKKVESVVELQNEETTVKAASSVKKFVNIKKPRTNNKEENSAPRSMGQRPRFKKEANSAPRDFQSVKDAIEAKINAFFESNQDAGLRKLASVSLLMDAGAHVGLPVRMQNPKMKMFVYPRRGNKNQVIDILKTLVFLNRAYNFLYDITKSGGTTLFVGTTGEIIKNHIKEEATRTKSYYINQRWLGGTLTNFRTIGKTINKLNKLINLTLTDEINKYSKKEQVDMNKEIERMTKFVGGIRTMRSLPQVVIVTDPVIEHNAVAEARKLNIPIIAITNTNANPENIDFIIPANSNSIRTVYLIISILADAIAEATEAETKIIGKKDEEITLPEIVKTPRKVVFHRQRSFNYERFTPRADTKSEVKTEK